MDDFRKLLTENEEWLTVRVLDHAKEHGYTPYTSTLVEAWRMAIRGISDSILEGTDDGTRLPVLGAEDLYRDDPVSAFGVLEARRHRERGIPLEMFLGLYKYIRQSFLELFQERGLDPGEEREVLRRVGRCFDRIEIAFVGEWSRVSDEEKLGELQDRNRAAVNEKNRFLTMVESHSDPAFLFDADNRVTYMNPAARELVDVPEEEGHGYYSGTAVRVQSREQGGPSPEETHPREEPLESSLFWLREPLASFVREEVESTTEELTLPDPDRPRIFRARFSRMQDISDKFAGTAVFVVEVTHERAMQRWLAESEIRVGEANRTLHAVLDAIPGGVFWKDLDGVYLGGNRVFCEDAGLENPEQAKGKTDFDLPWGKEQAEAYWEDDRWVIENGEPKLFFEESIPLEDGGTGWVRTSKVPLKTKEGEIVGVLGAYENITARKNMEMELRASEERFRSLFETLTQGIVYQNAGGTVTSANPAAEKILGLTLDQLTGKTSMDPHWRAVKEDGSDFPGEEHPAMVALRTGRPVENVVMGVYRPDSETYRWLRVDAVPEFQEGARRPHRVYAIFDDITDSKEAQEELEKSEALLAKAQSIASLGHWEWDPETNRILGSDELYRIFGSTREDLEGLDGFLKTIDPDDGEKLREEIQRALDGNAPYDLVYRIECPDGTKKVLHAEGEMVTREGGKGPVLVGTVQDISERWRAQESLRKREAQLQSIFRASPVGIGVTKDDIIQEVNQTAAEIGGYLREDLLGRNSAFLFESEEEYERVRQELWRQVPDGRAVRETSMLAKDGSVMDILLSAAPLDPQNPEAGHTWVSLDITERKEAEEKLRKSESRYREAERITQLGSWEMEIQTGESVWSDEFFRICGFEPGSIEPTAEAGFELIHPDDRDRAAAAVEDSIRTGSPYSIEKRIVRPDGEVRWVHSRGEVLRDDRGEPLRLMGSFLDITERWMAQEALRSREAQLQSIFRAAPVGIGVVHGRTIKDLNQMALDLSGFTRDEILGSDVRMFYPSDEEYDRAGRETRAQLERNGQAQVEVTMVNGEGEPRDLIVSSSLMDPSDPSGDRTFIMVDITERKAAERKLAEYAQAQGVLLREVNHRVKNNLAAIVGMIRKEEDRSREAGKETCLPLLHDLVLRLQSLSTVHSLLSSSSWRPLELSRLSHEVIKGTVQGTTSPGTLHLDVQPTTVSVDSDQAHQLTLILNELATNSVKYGLGGRAEGEITVRAWQEDETVTLEYRDDGPGFPDRILAGEYPASSIGFSLIQGITRKSLRGHVEIENGGGAVTRLRFPASPGAQAPELLNV